MLYTVRGRAGLENIVLDGLTNLLARQERLEVAVRESK
jgi:hypothetical protein